MNTNRKTCLSILSATLLIGLTAPSLSAQDIIAACSDVIASHCADVVPGDGRLYACLYAHEDKVSEACDEAVADVHDQLDIFFELVRFAKQECRADIATHCGDVAAGGGRIYSCLKERESVLSASCAEVMSRISTE